MAADLDAYERCLGCGEDVTPCEVPDRCVLFGYKHVATGRHGCASPPRIGTPILGVATPGHEEPGWERSASAWEQARWVRNAR